MNATFPNDRRWSLTGTLLFHVAIVGSLFLLKCGGGGGGNGGLGYTGLMSMDVAAIGNDVDGWGDQQEEEAPSQTQVQEPVAQEDAAAITDDGATEETPVVSNKPNEKPTTKPKDPIIKPVKETKPQEVSGNLNNALGNIKKGGNGNTAGTGKQGAADGKIDGKGVLNGGGSLGDGGGQGGGSGTGTGPGTGPGSGPGSGGMNSSFDLKGRGMVSKPSMSETAPDEGVVVVDIWVDKNGTVTKAVANPSKSTSSNGELYKLAEKAAKKAKFSSSTTSNEQKGTIKITFKLH